MGYDVPMKRNPAHRTVNLEKYGIKKLTVHSGPVISGFSRGRPIYAKKGQMYFAPEGVSEHATCALIAKGDSMINARIQDGDLVFIMEQPWVENGEIAAVIIDDEAMLRRFYFDRKNATITLVAANPAYAPLVYSGEQSSHVRIFGKVVAFQSFVQ